MDWQLAVAINVMALSAFSIAFSLMRWRSADVPWLALHALVLIIGGAGLYWDYANTGAVLGAIFGPFVLLPGYLMLRGNRATARGDYATAARYVSVAAALHPSRKMRFNAGVTRAFALGDAEGIREALAGLRGTASLSQQTFLDVTAARLQARWDDVLRIVSGVQTRQPELLEFEVRALGELGHVNEMVRAYQEVKSLLYGDAVRHCQLFVLAFCGRPGAVSILTGNKQAAMHAEAAEYWQAVACAYDPARRDEGRARLGQLAECATLANVQKAARFALASTVRPRMALAPETVAEADALAKRWIENAPVQSATLLRSPVTLTLLAANGFMFGLEYAFGGPEDLTALYKLGALWPGSLSDPAEWWRVPAAMFLHFGWPHLIMNMLSLALLGRMVEAAFRSARMFLIYALSGLGSMAAVVALMQLKAIHADFLVGASGAIMGLIGAWAGRTLRQYFSSRDALDKRQVGALAVVMLGQFALDLAVPQVSFTAHATGFVIGLILGLLLKPGEPRARVQ